MVFLQITICAWSGVDLVLNQVTIEIESDLILNTPFLLLSGDNYKE